MDNITVLPKPKKEAPKLYTYKIGQKFGRYEVIGFLTVSARDKKEARNLADKKLEEHFKDFSYLYRLLDRPVISEYTCTIFGA